MRLPIAALATAASLCAGAARAAAVEVRDAVAQVTVIPENRADVRVEFLKQNPRLPLKVRALRDRIVVDGKLKQGRLRSCRAEDGEIVVRVSGVGEVPLRDMPQVLVRTPRDVDLTAGGAVFGSVGRAANVSLGNAGCGDWTVANVEQRLRISQAGSGGTRAGTSGEARLRTAGSGNIAIGEVRGRLDVDVAGSGDVWVRSMSGPLDVHVAGSGDVVIAGGHASAMTATVAGSGDVSFDGVADKLNARIAGSGDVRAREVRGPVRKAVIGSGQVRIR